MCQTEKITDFIYFKVLIYFKHAEVPCSMKIEFILEDFDTLLLGYQITLR